MKIRPRTRALAALAALLAVPAGRAGAASLDLSSDIRARYLSYSNLGLQPNGGPIQAFISQGGRLGVTLKNIYLTGPTGDQEKFDLGLAFSAYGIGGSTIPVQSPFDRAAARLPSSNLTPFISAAYLKFYNAFDSGWEVTVGRMPFVLGSGLLVADDGVGLQGLALRRTFDWHKTELQAFGFEPNASQTGNSNVDVYGLQASLPTDGRWSLAEVVERQRSATVLAVPVSQALREFTSLRYAIDAPRFSFDGEAVLLRGSAKPEDPTLSNISYQGGAYRMEGRWKQDMGRLGQGIAKLVVGRGTGDDPGSPGTAGAFFPLLGHRYDGLERSGYGDLFGASLSDALIGSTSTANGLPAGVSGLRLYGLGVELPAPKGWTLSLDYYFFFADRSLSSSTALGRELDIGLERRYGDKLAVRLRQAFFTALSGLTATSTSASRLMVEVSGRF